MKDSKNKGLDPNPIESEHDKTIRSDHDNTIRSNHDNTIRSDHDNTIRSDHDNTIRSDHDHSGSPVGADSAPITGFDKTKVSEQSLPTLINDTKLGDILALSKEKNVRRTRNRWVHLEMRIGVETFLFKLIIYLSIFSAWGIFLSLGTLNPMPVLYTVLILIFFLLLQYFTDNHHIIDTRENTLKVKYAFMSYQSMKTIFKFDEIHAFSTQCYWNRGLDHKINTAPMAPHRCALVAIGKNGKIIQLSDRINLIRRFSWQEKNPVKYLNRKAKYLARITDSLYVQGDPKSRLLVHCTRKTDVEVKFQDMSGSIRVHDTMDRTPKTDDNQKAVDSHLQSTAMRMPVAADFPSLRELKIRAHRSDYQMPAPDLTDNLKKLAEYVAKLEFREGLWADFDALENRHWLVTGRRRVFQNNERQEEMFDFHLDYLDRFTPKSEMHRIEIIKRRFTRVAIPFPSKALMKETDQSVFQELNELESKWIAFDQLEREYIRQLGWRRLFSIEERQELDLNREQIRLKKQCKIYNRLLPAIYRHGKWTRSLLTFPLSKNTPIRFEENLAFNLQWKSQIQETMDSLPWELAEEVSPPHPPYNQQQVKEFIKLMKPVVQRSVRKAKIRRVSTIATLCLGLATLALVWISLWA